MRRLFALRTDFTAGAARTALIERARARPPRQVAGLRRLHDALLFLRAFPDSPAVHRAAGSALEAFHRMARSVPGARRRASESGIVGTVTHFSADFAIADWLNRSFPAEVDIDWPALDDETMLGALVRPLLQRAEEDAIDSGALSIREWLALRRGTALTDLAVLLEAAPAGRAGRRAFAARYDDAAIPIRWSLGDSAGAATHTRLRSAPVHYRRALRPPPADPVRFIAAPTTGITPLSGRRANEVIHVARAALAARGREVYAVTNANPAEVYLADLGEGASIAVIGLLPEYRMSLEANYGYLMFSNGVPVAYGGVTPLYRQANTGLNVFPEFRGSEAAYLWVAALRAFRSLFSVRRFVVNGYQVGEDNPEAIRSGAFWFYYRLGFRPADVERQRLARRERARLEASRARTGPAMLKRLASGDLWLDLPGCRGEDYFDEQWLVECSRRVTRLLAAVADTPPRDAARAVADRMARTLGARAVASRPRAEREAFGHLAPVCALLPGADRWSPASRAAVARLMLSKGGPRERDFVMMAQRDPRFFPGLIRLFARGAAGPPP